MPLLTLPKRALVGLFAAMGFCFYASAQLAPVIESFDYTLGASLNGQNGGSGFSGAWSGGSYTIEEPGLQYPGVLSSGGVARSSAQSGGSAFRDLTDVWGQDGTTFYFGAIMEKTSDTDPSRFFGLALYRDNEELTLLGQPSGWDKWTFSKTGLNTPISSQTQVLLLVRVDAREGNDTITLWVDPNLSLTEAQNTPIGTSMSFDLGTVNRIRIGGGNATQAQVASENVIDEIFFRSDSPFAVIPEPAALPLLAVIAVAVFIWRKRRA